MAALDSTWLYIALPWVYLIPLASTLVYNGCASFYLFLHYSTMALLHSISLYISLPWLYFTVLYISLSWLYVYLIRLYSTWLYHGSTWLYFTLYDYHSSTYFGITLPWLNFTPLHSTLLYHGSTFFYFTLHNSTIALLDTNSLKMILPWVYTSLYITQPLFYLTLLHSRWFYNGSTWLYITLPLL